MATLASNLLTIADVAKLFDPQGKPAAIAELLSQTNGIIQDVPFVEGNLMNGHETTVRTSLPTISARQANQGTTPTKSTTAQAVESATILEAWVEIDEVVAERNGNVAATRMSQALPHAEAMGQTFAQQLVYGNQSTTPTDINGFNTRYTSLSGTNAQNIIDAGGTGSDNSSILLVGWGAGKVYGFYPKGTQAGLKHTDWGKSVIEDTAGIGNSRLAAYREQWQWQFGLAVEDWRYAVRICNIDISNLVAKSSAADLFDVMIQATHVIPNLENVRPVFYVNRTTLQMLDIQGRDDVVSGGQLRYDMVDGKRILSFRGIPVKLLDRLTETEARVT